MAVNNHAEQNSRGTKAYDFKPVDYDAETMEPDAYPGAYTATVDEVKISKTSKDSFPMVIVEWKLDAAADEEDENCVKSVGASVADFLTFFPEGDKRGKMGKLRLRQLCEKLNIDITVIPKRIQSKADFDEFKAALMGQSMDVWVTAKTDEASGETRTSINYTAPKGMHAADETEEEAPAAPVKGRGAKAPPAKKAARR